MITGKKSTAKPRKTKPKGRHPHHALSAVFIRSAPPGRHADGNGLYLYVQPSGARSWIQRLVIRGRRRELGLGSVALVSLAEAREKARANRKLAREGGDPLAEKRRARGVPSFAEAAARVVEQQKAGWRDPKYPRVWLGSLERYAFGAHRQGPGYRGHRRRHLRDSCAHLACEGPHCADCAPPDTRGAGMGRGDGTAARQPVRPHRAGVGSSEQRGAAHEGFAAPAGGIGSPEGAEVGLSARRKAGIRVLVLTAARWGEVRGAVWSEIDRGESVWTIPATRMKTKREHRVPLCGRALEILYEARRLRAESPIVFSRPRGRGTGGETSSSDAQEAPDRGGAARVPFVGSATGPPRRLTIPERSSRRRSRMSFGTR